MAEVQLSTVVDLDLVKMKWREQYVSEGLNRKLVPSQPPGIYQGLRIVENITSPRQVELAPDATSNFHMAVYQSTTGYSLTYWDFAGSSIILDLSDANLSNQETVIGLEMDYQIGADTTANWMAFPVADWDALPAARKDEIVVLGTVQVPPLLSDNILQNAISYKRATYAWSNLSKGNVPWSPVLRNGDFEQGVEGTTRAFYWELTATNGSGSGTVLLSSTNPDRNLMALRMSSVTSGSMTLDATQSVVVPATPGQLIMVRGRKYQTLAPSSGTIDLDLVFSDDTGNDTATVTVNIDGGTTDVAYEDFLEIVEVPAGVSVLERVSIGGTVTYGSGPAVGIDIDDVQVWLESQGDRSDLEHGVSGDLEVRGKIKLHRTGVAISSLDRQTIEALGSIDLQTPAGSFRVPNGDLRALDFIGDAVDLGDNLRGSAADAILPRIRLRSASSGTSSYTLLGEFQPGTGSTYSRLYVNSSGDLCWTRNAWWSSSSLWQKDSDNSSASFFTLKSSSVQNNPGILMKTRALTSNGTWADTGWTYEEALEVRIAQNGATGLRVDNGDGYMATSYLFAATNKSPTTANTNTLYANNIVKAWGTVTAGEFTGPVLRNGFNVSSITDLGITFQVNLAASMVDANYSIVATMAQGLGDGGSATLDSFVTVTAQSTSAFTLEAVSHSGTTQSIAGGLNSRVFFAVIGEQ